MIHTNKQLLDRYDKFLLEIKQVTDMSGENVQDNINKLNALENMKYICTYLLGEFESRLLVLRAEALKDILATEEYKKALNSSTLTTILIEEQTSQDQGIYRMLQEILRNIRSSLDVSRSILSAEKKLSEISNEYH